jgi:hypothetical protein
MPKPTVSRDELKRAVKEALVELLVEEREMLRSVLLQAAEDAALGHAIMEARNSKLVSRRSISKLLKGKK